MARPTRQTATAAGALPPVILNNLAVSPFNVGVGVVLSAGASLTYTVEHTFDDVFAPTFNPATATWFPNSGLTAQTTSKDGNYTAPVAAVRLNVTAFTSGTATLVLIQAV
jgi:hypothetical protein